MTWNFWVRAAVGALIWGVEKKNLDYRAQMEWKHVIQLLECIGLSFLFISSLLGIILLLFNSF